MSEFYVKPGDSVSFAKTVGETDIYLFAAKQAGVPADACVFVDDFSVNVKGAEAVGMSGILHRDARATIERLEDLFGLSLETSG